MQSEKEVQVAIGDRIKKIREGKHMSQDKLYELSGVKNTTISAYENHKKRIGLANLANIAKGLGVTIDVLYYGEEEEAPITKSSGDLGKKVVNCVFELYKEDVIQAITIDKIDGDIEWRVGLFEQPLNKFLNTLEMMRGDYGDTPEQAAYVDGVKNTTAYEINKENESIIERKEWQKKLPSKEYFPS